MFITESTAPSLQPLLDDTQSITISTAPSHLTPETEAGCLHRAITALGRVLHRQRRPASAALNVHFHRGPSWPPLGGSTRTRPSDAVAARLADALPPEVLTHKRTDVQATAKATIGTQTLSPDEPKPPRPTESAMRRQHYLGAVADRELLISEVQPLIDRLPDSMATPVRAWIDSQRAINVLQAPERPGVCGHGQHIELGDRAMRLIKRSRSAVAGLKPLLNESPSTVPGLLSVRDALPAHMEALLPNPGQAMHFETLMDRLAEVRSLAGFDIWRQAAEHLMHTVEESNRLMPEINRHRKELRDDPRLLELRDEEGPAPPHYVALLRRISRLHDRSQVAMTYATGGALAARHFLAAAQVAATEAARQHEFLKTNTARTSAIEQLLVAHPEFDSGGIPRSSLVSFGSYLSAAAQITQAPDLLRALEFTQEVYQQRHDLVEAMDCTRLFVALHQDGMAVEEADALARLFSRHGTACIDDLAAVAHALKGTAASTLHEMDRLGLRVHVCCDRLTEAMPTLIGRNHAPWPTAVTDPHDAADPDTLSFWEDEVLHAQDLRAAPALYVAVRQRNPATRAGLAIQEGRNAPISGASPSAPWREVPPGCREQFDAVVRSLRAQPAP